MISREKHRVQRVRSSNVDGLHSHRYKVEAGRFERQLTAPPIFAERFA